MNGTATKFLELFGAEGVHVPPTVQDFCPKFLGLSQLGLWQVLKDLGRNCCGKVTAARLPSPEKRIPGERRGRGRLPSPCGSRAGQRPGILAGYVCSQPCLSSCPDKHLFTCIPTAPAMQTALKNPAAPTEDCATQVGGKISVTIQVKLSSSSDFDFNFSLL